MKEEKDWSKATEAELITEAKRRYPVGTVLASSGINDWIDNPHEILIPIRRCEFRAYGDHIDTLDGCGLVYCKKTNRWAEVVSQPIIQEEPKAGDMVEGSFDGIEWYSQIYVVFALGKHYCMNPGSDGTHIHSYNFIRLHQKSEVESKAKWFWECEENQDLPAINIIEQAIKWGQQNPNSK